MRQVLVLLLLSLVAALPQDALPVELHAGAFVDRSTRVRPGTYRLRSASLDVPAIRVTGHDVTLDLSGVTIEGGDPYADPDGDTGVGILIDGGSHVTIKGGTIRGYKIGVRAAQTPALHITGLDASDNWKPRLLSGIEHENQADWLDFHNNEHDEWLRYGAGIYLNGCDDCEVDNSRVVQSMNGLLAMKSARLRIWNDTFSWDSGLGIGLYRVTDSRISHNKLDWDVRGYSDGFYNRGQDSAALLMYEQTSHNVVDENSMTHGGDGVFLWGGQSTMDTGQGGSNDNWFVGNDVSSAVANGIEATFSRNKFTGNRIDDCWHGIWGGYSFDSLVDSNEFDGNTEGIAIEHGQNISIIENTFKNSDTAIRLWANPSQDPNWGYPKARDTTSHGYTIVDNTFDTLKTALDIQQTSDARFVLSPVAGAEPNKVGTLVRLGSDVTGFSRDRRPADGERVELDFVPPPPAGAMDAKLPPNARRGRATIIVDEWGPYDYRSPKLWPAGRPTDRPLKLRVLGPAGKWRLRSSGGAAVSKTSGTIPDEILVTPKAGAADIDIALAYTGGEVVSPRGAVTPAGKPYAFSYSAFAPAVDWTVKFWKFDVSTDPLAYTADFEKLLVTAPARIDHLASLDYPTATSFGEGFADHIGVMADGTVTLPSGAYQLVITSDDGIKAWVDDQLVAEDWSIHGAKDDVVPLAGGRHRLRIEYFQNTGSAALSVQIVRK